LHQAGLNKPTDRTDYVFFFNNKKYTENHTFREEYQECGIKRYCSKASSTISRQQNVMMMFPVVKSLRQHPSRFFLVQ
jgi:hypothetical protein